MVSGADADLRRPIRAGPEPVACAGQAGRGRPRPPGPLGVPASQRDDEFGVRLRRGEQLPLVVGPATEKPATLRMLRAELGTRTSRGSCWSSSAAARLWAADAEPWAWLD